MGFPLPVRRALFRSPSLPSTAPTPPRRRRIGVTALGAGLAGAAALSVAVAAPAGAATLDPHAPFGTLDPVTVSAGGATVTGTAADPDTSAPITAWLVVDSDYRDATRLTADRPDAGFAAQYPTLGADHGFSTPLAVDGAGHQVCLWAHDPVLSWQQLACVASTAASTPSPSPSPSPSPTPPPGSVRRVASPPRHFTATRAARSVTLHWASPADPGSAAVTGYRVARPHATARHLDAGARSLTVTGLRPATRYRITVAALSPAGRGHAAAVTVVTRVSSGSSHTPRHSRPTHHKPVHHRPAPHKPAPHKPVHTSIPPQRTPAPVSTSHYLRSLTGSAGHDEALMRRMGANDAAHNPSGHRYLVLQDIGAQAGGGVVLSATVKWVSFASLVRGLDAYVAGYASQQRGRAPMLLAIGTNNDGPLSAAVGRAWADQVVDPVRRYAARFGGIEVAGANDIEPGFSAGPAATRAWLSGFLSATRAPFVFNGSADGCPTSSGWRCNNGWTTGQLHWLAGGAAPGRIVSLPQIYNTAMPEQWRVISAAGSHKVYFGGPLTEWTACRQARSCSSASNVSAWAMLHRALAANPRTAQGVMPFGTDLRIN